jgi:hypothetical protein
LQSVRLLRYGWMGASPSLTVFLGQAGDAVLAGDFENRPVDTDSSGNRANHGSPKISFEFKSANF